MITVDAATTTEATLCGDALTWSYDKDTAVLTVSGNGDMYDYAKEKAPWYSSRKAIKEIHIGKDVTSIGNYAFYNLIAVETVVFGEVVTDDESVSGNDPSVSENDPSVSENDPSVSDNNPSVSENNLTVSDNNASETDNETTLTQKDVYESSLKKIGRNAFHSMKKLKTIQLPDSVESLGYQCFASCTNLQYVTLSKNWKECPTHTEGKSGIDYQGRIFEESNMIVDVICPEGMTIVPAYAFAKTWTMTEVRLPETVTEIGAYAYYDCENLARIDFPDTVETIGNNAFAECIDLRVIDMSESMETIPKDAFKGDTALTAVFFKDAIKNIDAGAFNGCKNVENLYYTGTKAQWEEVSVGANNTILDNAVWEYESVAGFVRPTYIREKSYTQPATNLPASFYGGRKKGNMITLTEEEFENAFFGPDSDMYGVSIPKDCYITFGFDKAYKCPETATLIVTTDGLTDERSDYYAETISGEYIYIGTVYESKDFHTLSIGHIDEYIVGIKVVGRDLEGEWPGADLIGIILVADLPGVQVEMLSKTRVTLNRKAECYDLLRESQNFAIDSKEEATILVSADWKEYEPGTIVLMQGGKEILRNQGGSFVDIQPAQLFQPYEDITVCLLDANDEIVEEIKILLTVGASTTTRLDLDTKTVSVVVHEQAGDTNDDSGIYVLSEDATISYGKQKYKTDANGVTTFTKGTADSVIISKEGFKTRAYTLERLKKDKNVYLYRSAEGKSPYVYAVWVDDVNALTKTVFVSDGDVVKIVPELNTEDYEWGSVTLTQDSTSIRINKNGTKVCLSDSFVLDEPIYMRAKTTDGTIIKKELKIMQTPMNKDQNLDFEFSFSDDMSLTLPEDIEPEFFAGLPLEVNLIESIIPVSVEVEGNEFKVAIGIETDNPKEFVKKIKEKQICTISDDAIEGLQKLRNLKKTFDVKDVPASFGIEGSMTVMGYMEGSITSAGEIRVAGGGLAVGINGAVDEELPFMAGPIPLYFEAEIEAAIESALGLEYREATQKITPKGTLSGELGVSGGLGVGAADVLYASGGLTGTIKPTLTMFSAEHKKNHLLVTAAVEAYATLGIAGFEYNPKWPIGEEIILVDTDKNSGTPGHGHFSVGDKALQEAQILEIPYDTSVYRLKNLSYIDGGVTLYDANSGNGNRAMSGAFSEKVVTSQTLVNDIYKQSTPQYVMLENGKQIAVWLDASSSDANAVCLYYAYYDGTKWSEPAMVSADGTMDYAPVLAELNGKVYLAWQDATQAFALNETSKLDDIAPYFDISLSVFDESKGFTSKITIPYTGLDMMPALCASADTVYVGWVNNSVNDWFGTTADNHIIYATFDGVTVGTPTSSVGNLTAVGSLKIDYHNGLNVAYVCDTDGNLKTENDKHVFENGTRVSAEDRAAYGPYYYNHELYWYANQSVISKNCNAGGGITSHRYVITEHNGQKVLFFVDNEGIYSTLKAAYFDESANAFGAPIAISNGSNYIGAFSADCQNGITNLLVNSMAVVDNISSGQPYGTASLELISLNTYSDIAITDIIYDEDTFCEGEQMEFTVEFTNRGTQSIDTVTVEVQDTDGNVLSQRNLNVALMAGATTQIKTYYNVPKSTSEETLVIYVYPTNFTDCNMTDNEQTIELHYEDITVENITWGMRGDGKIAIQADIVNRGYSTVDKVTVQLYKESLEGTALEEKVLQDIAPLDMKPVTFEQYAQEDTIYYIAVSTQGDSYTYNNSEYILIDCVEPTEDERTTYSVSFDSAGGTKVADITGIVAGSTITLPEEPTKENCVFLGWYTEVNGGGTLFTEETVITDNITLYAFWKEEAQVIKGLWIKDIPNQVYTGKNVQPEVIVYDGAKRLVKGTDYTVSYKNCKNANDASVVKKAPTAIVKYKGNYSGTKAVTYKIMQKDISANDIVFENLVAAYNGRKQKVAPVVTWNGTKLKNNRDYVIVYDTNETYTDVKDYTITIQGKNNFTNSTKVTFSVVDKKLISKAKLTKIQDQKYTGSPITPEFVLRNGSDELEAKTHYEIIEYVNNTAIGTASIRIKGIGEYAGERTITFKIVGAPISKAKLNNFASWVFYSGNKVKQNVVLTYQEGDKTIPLIAGRDYKVSYANNLKVGTATVIYTGKGKYSGVLKKTFKIKPYNISSDYANMVTYQKNITAVHAKGGSKPDVTIWFDDVLLKNGVDYTLSYAKNKDVNDGKETQKAPVITIKGKGNYTGSIKVNYAIITQNLENVTMEASDVIVNTKAGKWKSVPALTDLDGKKLSINKDYEKEMEYTYVNQTTLADGTQRNAGAKVEDEDIVPTDTEICITVEGMKNYTGRQSCTYRIVEKTISAAKVTIDDIEYTGKAIEAIPKCVMLGDEELRLGYEYRIKDGSYKNNTKVGKASFVIEGIGEKFGGTKTVTFKIVAKSHKE